MNNLDALTRLAFLGTAQAPEPASLDGVAGLTARALGSLAVEKRVLLAAGTRGVASAAGARPRPFDTREDAAPAETLEVCPPRVKSLLVEMLAENNTEMLRALFERMALARRRVPHELLPQVLALSGAPREVLAPALGERGQWLARLHPKWRTVLSGAVTAPEEADRLWAEGAFEERRALLEQTRSTEPARARDWLQATFGQEKAEHRARFLSSLLQGLSAEDEPLLELGRKDRAPSVREVARDLLSRLPTSAFGRRMEERARNVLRWEAPGTLGVRLPEKWDAEAERDGLDKAPPGIGQSEHWLSRLLSAVPLSTWERAFGATPVQLLAAAEQSEDGTALSIGWGQAARLGASNDWTTALFDFWSRRNSKLFSGLGTKQSVAEALLLALPPAKRAEHALRALQDRQRHGTSSIPFRTALLLTPAPWPEALARAWLTALRQLGERTNFSDDVLNVLTRSARILPDSCLAAAAEPFELPAALSAWQGALHRFQTSVSLCRILHEELKP